MAGSGAKKRAKTRQKALSGGRGTIPLPMIKLDTVDNAITSLESICQLYGQGEITREQAMGFTYCFNVLTGLLRLKKEELIDQRLKNIEDRLERILK